MFFKNLLVFIGLFSLLNFNHVYADDFDPGALKASVIKLLNAKYNHLRQSLDKRTTKRPVFVDLLSCASLTPSTKQNPDGTFVHAGCDILCQPGKGCVFKSRGECLNKSIVANNAVAVRAAKVIEEAYQESILNSIKSHPMVDYKGHKVTSKTCILRKMQHHPNCTFDKTYNTENFYTFPFEKLENQASIDTVEKFRNKLKDLMDAGSSSAEKSLLETQIFNASFAGQAYNYDSQGPYYNATWGQNAILAVNKCQGIPSTTPRSGTSTTPGAGTRERD